MKSVDSKLFVFEYSVTSDFEVNAFILIKFPRELLRVTKIALIYFGIVQ